MTFTLPGGSPDLKTAIERYSRQILSFPLRLWRPATAELPPAADFEGGIVWDSTLDRVAVSDGANWGTLQPYDADVAAYGALTGTGLVARTGAGTAATRTLTGPAAGLTVTNGNGEAGNPTLALANDLAALEGLAGTGLPKRTGTDTWTAIVHDEGTFTPTFTFGGGSTGMTFSERSGVYRRVGNMVLVEIRIVLSAKGSSTGTAVVGALPATAAVRSTGVNVGTNYAASTAPVGLTLPGTATIELRDIVAGNSVAMTHANFNNNTAINMAIAYSA